MKKKCPVSYETLGIKADMKPRDYIKHLRERIEEAKQTFDSGALNILRRDIIIEEYERLIKWIEFSAMGEQ